MVAADIGRVTPIWRGIYSAETAYELNDIVLDAECSVWWHVSEEITVGVSPGPGAVWAAVIDMSVFSDTIQAAIAEAQAAVREAEEAARTLEGFAERAEAAASEATLSAGAASDFATAASDEKREAEAARAGAETAQSAAETAQTAAETAQTAAETAQTAAETARSGAQTARTGAEAARDTAQTYEQSAAAAKDDAELARDKAEEYAEALEVQIDPTFRTPGTAAESVAVSKKTASAVTASASGNTIVLPDAAGERVLRSVKVNVEPVQSGSGDPSPSNVRPISGWTGAKVTRCGKNLLSVDNLTEGLPSSTSFSNNTKRTFQIGTYVTNLAATNYYQANQVTAKSISNGEISVTSTAKAYALSIPLANLKPSQPYTFSVETNDGDLTVSFYKKDGTYIGLYSGVNKITFTIPDETYYTLFHFRPTENGVPATFQHIQLELGSVETEYEPYEGDVFEVEFPSEAGTVYGGTLDLTAGTLTVDRLIFSANTATMNNNDNYPGWRPAGIGQFGPVNGQNTNALMNIGKVYGVNAATDTMFLPVATYGKTQTEWKALAQDVQILYTLVTPITYTLTPQQIAALAGLNNVWADCGPVEVEWVRDTEAVIDAGDASTRAMIGETSGTTASRSLAVGEYVTVGDKLYRVTSAVGAGETLTPGSNVTETTVGAELTALYNLINS